MISIVTVRPGLASSSQPFTMLAWVRASALPRLPRRMSLGFLSVDMRILRIRRPGARAGARRVGMRAVFEVLLRAVLSGPAASRFRRVPVLLGGERGRSARTQSEQ